jgi:hypothetical protein
MAGGSVSDYGIPDVLGPQFVQYEGGALIPLRQTLRVGGGADVKDDAPRLRTRLTLPDPVYRVVTISSDALSNLESDSPELTQWVVGLSNADLVRLENNSGETIVIGMADLVERDDGYDLVQAIPDKRIKFLANCGTYKVTLQPPAAELSDPDSAGIFLDSITLYTHDVVRVYWDSISAGYRIQGGSHTYITYEGHYVVHDGQRIYRRT